MYSPTTTKEAFPDLFKSPHTALVTIPNFAKSGAIVEVTSLNFPAPLF